MSVAMRTRATLCGVRCSHIAPASSVPDEAHCARLSACECMPGKPRYSLPPNPLPSPPRPQPREKP